MAGDEQVAADAIAEGLHRPLDLPALVGAQVDHCVPRLVTSECFVVALLAIADQSLDLREQVGSGLAPVENRDLGAMTQGVVDDGAADERSTSENENAHGSDRSTGLDTRRPD